MACRVSNELLGKFPIPNQLPRNRHVSSNLKTPKVFFAHLPEKGPNCSPVSITFPLRQPFARSLQLASLMTKWRSPFCSRRRTCNKIDATDSKNDWLVVSKVFKYSSCSILHHGLCWTVRPGYDWQSLWDSAGVVCDAADAFFVLLRDVALWRPLFTSTISARHSETFSRKWKEDASSQ